MTIDKILFTTDFGLSDHYVAVTKCSLLNSLIHTPPSRVQFVDVSHSVRRHNLRKAAYIAAVAAKHGGENSLSLVVVDPGVGTERKVVVYRTRSDGIFVAPDNGVLSLAYDWFPGECFTAEVQQGAASTTFHARDVFAPLAAKLIDGYDLQPDFNPTPIDEVVNLELKQTEKTRGGIRAVVLYVDVFGNVITNLPNGALSDASLTISAHGHKYHASLARSYGHGGSGKLLVIAGSEGFYELAVNRGSASRMLHVREGEVIEFA